ncbi:MAG TPA: hypothetical protein VMM76_16220 [Pirellulaceae bacterium]|nr:hypothetical protein [Pirellulaceae bacterium]
MPTTHTHSKSKVEYGDFQTPPGLAREVCCVLAKLGIRPEAILEPTCGRGSLLEAAAEEFVDANQIVGFDVNPDHVAWTRAQLKRFQPAQKVIVETSDFFEADWPHRLAQFRNPLLIIGNPPWVTNSALGGLGSGNLPEKRNTQGLRGIEALTGKSNFDISEWMLLRVVEWMQGRDATLAMLCKTAVARKVLQRGWSNNAAWSAASIYGIDALRHFEAAVDACLLVIRSAADGHPAEPTAAVFETLASTKPSAAIGLRDGALVADVTAYERSRHLAGRSPVAWRSGVKHDCSKVLELRREGDRFRNGLGELVSLERQFVFPMLKSSDIAQGNTTTNRWMLVTQRSTGEDTSTIEDRAPRTWAYLLRHAELLDRRGSSIYRGRPRFSIFGVGDYTFTPWKVAISGFYKRLAFQLLGPIEGQPVVLDDTCYVLPCDSAEQARTFSEMLNSEAAQQFLSAFVFWDSKRPITIALLQRLDLAKLADELGFVLEK